MNGLTPTSFAAYQGEQVQSKNKNLQFAGFKDKAVGGVYGLFGGNLVARAGEPGLASFKGVWRDSGDFFQSIGNGSPQFHEAANTIGHLSSGGVWLTAAGVGVTLLYKAFQRFR